MSIVWLDGELVDKADAKIGVADHGLLFGDGVTADMRAYGRRVFRLATQLERLQTAATDIGLSLPVAGDKLAAAVDATLKANNRTDGFVKVIVTRGAGPLTLDPRKCVPFTIILAEEAAPFPRELYDGGIDVAAVAIFGGREADTRLAKPNRVTAKREALQAGCLEGLLVAVPLAVVFGGSETDVGWVRGGQAFFAEGSVTHIALAEAVGGISQHLPGLSDLAAADEVFLTSAAAEVIAVRSIDGKPLGSGGEGPVTRRLRDEFAAMVRRECAVD